MPFYTKFEEIIEHNAFLLKKLKLIFSKSNRYPLTQNNLDFQPPL